MANLKLRAAIIQTVNQQLNKNNPPEVRIALGRMMDNDPDCDYDEAFRRIKKFKMIFYEHNNA